MLQLINNRILLSAVTCLTFTTGAAKALEFNPNVVTVAVWENSSGFWFACGPVQCLAFGQKDPDDAFDLVTGDRDGSYSHIGDYGRCRVFQAQRETESYENSARRAIDRAKC